VSGNRVGHSGANHPWPLMSKSCAQACGPGPGSRYRLGPFLPSCWVSAVGAEADPSTRGGRITTGKPAAVAFRSLSFFRAEIAPRPRVGNPRCWPANTLVAACGGGRTGYDRHAAGQRAGGFPRSVASDRIPFKAVPGSYGGRVRCAWRGPAGPDKQSRFGIRPPNGLPKKRKAVRSIIRIDITLRRRGHWREPVLSSHAGLAASSVICDFRVRTTMVRVLDTALLLHCGHQQRTGPARPSKLLLLTRAVSRLATPRRTRRRASRTSAARSAGRLRRRHACPQPSVELPPRRSGQQVGSTRELPSVPILRPRLRQQARLTLAAVALTAVVSA